MKLFDQEEYLEELRLEDKFTKRPSVWEVSKSFPDCRVVALRVAYDLSISLKEYDEDIKKEPLISEFIKTDLRWKRLDELKKYLKITSKSICKKELDIESAKRVPILSLYDFEKKRVTSKRIQAICPFHKDKATPSLMIYTDQNSFHCFGCNKGGSSIDFIMNLKDVNFVEAVKILNKGK